MRPTVPYAFVCIYYILLVRSVGLLLYTVHQCITVCLSVCLSICLSVCVFLCLSGSFSYTVLKERSIVCYWTVNNTPRQFFQCMAISVCMSRNRNTHTHTTLDRSRQTDRQRDVWQQNENGQCAGHYCLSVKCWRLMLLPSLSAT